MKPFINKNILTFNELYEYWDQAADDNHRAGFKQMWEASPFYMPDADLAIGMVQETYYRLQAKFFTTPFGMLDERQIHLNVFKTVKDYLPNLLKRIDTYENIYNTDLQSLTLKQNRTNQNTSTGTGSFKDTGYENQATAPNTQGSVEQPILDMISAQRNKNMTQDTEDSRNSNTQETVNAGIAEGYDVKLRAIVDGLWDEYIDRFNKLFVKLYVGAYDYVYLNEIEEDQ